MPQLHVYVPDPLAREARRRAQERGLSISSFLAEILERELGSGWPESYFTEVVGSWQGEELERPEQPATEQRDPLGGG